MPRVGDQEYCVHGVCSLLMSRFASILFNPTFYTIAQVKLRPLLDGVVAGRRFLNNDQNVCGGVQNAKDGRDQRPEPCVLSLIRTPNRIGVFDSDCSFSSASNSAKRSTTGTTF